MKLEIQGGTLQAVPEPDPVDNTSAAVCLYQLLPSRPASRYKLGSGHEVFDWLKCAIPEEGKPSTFVFGPDPGDAAHDARSQIWTACRHAEAGKIDHRLRNRALPTRKPPPISTPPDDSRLFGIAVALFYVVYEIGPRPRADITARQVRRDRTPSARSTGGGRGGR